MPYHPAEATLQLAMESPFRANSGLRLLIGCLISLHLKVNMQK